jgi:hypothetical protein
MDNELAKRGILPYCPKCGSEDIIQHALARWDMELQDWDLCALTRPIVCQDCKEEFDLPKERPVLMIELGTMH